MWDEDKSMFWDIFFKVSAVVVGLLFTALLVAAVSGIGLALYQAVATPGIGE